jgi:ABC-type multidrug transport system ATPase subunit
MLADRIAVLNTRLLAMDAPSALRQLFAGARVEIEVEGPADAWQSAIGSTDATSVSASGSVLALTLVDHTRIPDLVGRLVHAGARIRRVTPSERTLEEVYLSLVGDQGHAA